MLRARDAVFEPDFEPDFKTDICVYPSSSSLDIFLARLYASGLFCDLQEVTASHVLAYFTQADLPTERHVQT